jgi:hypothetical protein
MIMKIHNAVIITSKPLQMTLEELNNDFHGNVVYSSTALPPEVAKWYAEQQSDTTECRPNDALVEVK